MPVGSAESSGNRTAASLAPSAVLRAVHERFLSGDIDACHLDSTSLRSMVAESWRRSLATGVDPDLKGARPSPVALTVAEMRHRHPLASALPVIERLLISDATDAGVVVAVSAADGTLLWVEGDPNARRKAEAMNFVPGADWSEGGAGTNAPGTALALDREVQIRGSEHFSRIVQPWSCTAVPVHDPTTGALIGTIDLTGRSEVAAPQTLALVRATVAAVENHLALLYLTGRRLDDQPKGVARLVVLGADRPRWQVSDEQGQPRTTTLTGRHADILVLLSRHPEGLSADHLAMLLDETDLDVVTVRAEMSRLRRAIGAEFIGSRPYRLLVPIASDVKDVFDALANGDVETALAHYTAPLLAQSVSPAIARLRIELSASIRGAVLATKDLALLRRWLDLPEGRDDRDGWRTLQTRAAEEPAIRAQAGGHLAGLDFELG
jgi:GAF domain